MNNFIFNIMNGHNGFFFLKSKNSVSSRLLAKNSVGTIHLRCRQIFTIFDPHPPTISIPANCLWRGFLILMYCDLWTNPSPPKTCRRLGWSLISYTTKSNRVELGISKKPCHKIYRLLWEFKIFHQSNWLHIRWRLRSSIQGRLLYRII